MGNNDKIIVFLQGPTASGKTNLRNETLKQSKLINGVFEDGITYPDDDDRVVYFGIDDKVEADEEYVNRVTEIVDKYFKKGEIKLILNEFETMFKEPGKKNPDERAEQVLAQENIDPVEKPREFIDEVDAVYNDVRIKKYEKAYEEVIKDFFKTDKQRVLIIETTGKHPPEKHFDAIPEDVENIKIVISHSIVNFANLKKRNFKRAHEALSKLHEYLKSVKRGNSWRNVWGLTKKKSRPPPLRIPSKSVLSSKNFRELVAKIVSSVENVNKGCMDERLDTVCTWIPERFNKKKSDKKKSDIELMIFDNNGEVMELIDHSIKLYDTKTTSHWKRYTKTLREQIFGISGLQAKLPAKFGKVLERAIERSSVDTVSKQLVAFGKLHPKYNKKCKGYIKFVKTCG